MRKVARAWLLDDQAPTCIIAADFERLPVLSLSACQYGLEMVRDGEATEGPDRECD